MRAHERAWTLLVTASTQNSSVASKLHCAIHALGRDLRSPILLSRDHCYGNSHASHPIIILLLPKKNLLPVSLSLPARTYSPRNRMFVSKTNYFHTYSSPTHPPLSDSTRSRLGGTPWEGLKRISDGVVRLCARGIEHGLSEDDEFWCQDGLGA